MPTEKGKARIVLTMSTIAFAVCFSAWMMNGVLITFLIENQVFVWDKSQVGWLIGVPVLTGSIIRLPVGVATDKYGGRIVYTIVMLISAVPMYLVSLADGFVFFILTGLGFGLAGTSFAVGIAYTSTWFERKHQGTALGIFGAGNAGAAATSVGAPLLLAYFTADGANLEGWRLLPQFYAAMLVAMALVFYATTYDRKVEANAGKNLSQRLAPLRDIRVWRFGFYYFIVFGGFVALAQWLVPYYVGAYALSVGLAGLLAAVFSFPSGVIRALGGWISDKWGARRVMYWVLGSCAILSLLLIPPQMTIDTPGEAVVAPLGGTITAIDDHAIYLDGTPILYTQKPAEIESGATTKENLIWPVVQSWHEPVVEVNDTVSRRQLLAKGVTHVFFQANVWVFTLFVFIIGIMMGIGKAAVYKHIPEYFPNDVGVVGGIVGVLGGLGGFVGPVLFGYLLDLTGFWTSSWLFLFVISTVALAWMHLVLGRMMKAKAPKLVRQIEGLNGISNQSEE